MEKIKIGLVQINNSYSGQYYLPYSVGLLQAYATKNAKNPEQFEFLPALFEREAPDKAALKLAKAHVVGFSTYVWNARLSLAIAKQLKKLNPTVVIVFGGPHVPDQPEEFLTQNPFIDIAVHGEGEVTFLEILENLKTKQWDSTGSISFVKNHQVITNPKKERLANLESIPSPYLTGVFDRIIAHNPQHKWIVVWETNRGCPFSCAYCDWGSATQSKVFKFDLERLFQEAQWFADLKVPFIFCADANFGMLDRDYDIAKKVADIRKATGFPQTLSVQNTKNSTEKSYRVQKLLVESGLNKSVTISFQTMDPQTLKNIKRANISDKVFKELQRRFTIDQIPTYSDIIIGLPGETYDSFADGVSQVISDGQHNRIVFNNLSILPNAAMNKPSYRKEFGIETIQSEVVYVRGSTKQETPEFPEIQELVVAVRSLPKEDWARCRAFAWTTGLLYFNKVLQIPLALIHEITNIPYRHLLESFTTGDLKSLPIIQDLTDFFIQKARAIQKGDYEFCPSDKWLGIFWPAEDFALIQLATENKLNAFYDEAEKALTLCLKRYNQSLPPELVKQAIELNRDLFKLPFKTGPAVFKADYNVFEFYNGIIKGNPIALESGSFTYKIDRSKQWQTWEDWCRELVWFGNKSAAYLYPINQTGTSTSEHRLAGHY